MNKFYIEIEKIARKWVTLKVQSKKDNTRFYTGYTTKENLMEVKNDAEVGTKMYVYADSFNSAGKYGTRYEFTLYVASTADTTPGDEEFATILATKDNYQLWKIEKLVRALKETGNHSYDDKVDRIIEEKKIEEKERWWGYVVDTYNNQGCIYKRGVEELHDLGDHTHDNEINEMKKEIEERKARRKHKEDIQKWWSYIVNQYNSEGTIYQRGIEELNKLDDHTHDDEIKKMKKAIEERKANLGGECTKKEIDWFAKIEDCEKGEIFFVGNEAYETLYSSYQRHDGWSFGVQSEGWYKVTGKRITDTQEGQKLLIQKKEEEAEEEQKQRKKEETQELLKRITNQIEKNGVLNETKTSLNDIENGGVVIYDTFNDYGGGKKIVVKSKETWLIINNGADAWATNTISTGGAGAYAYIIKNNSETLSLINKYINKLGDSKMIEITKSFCKQEKQNESKKSFMDINKKIDEVFEKDSRYYRVTNITETCSIYDDDGVIVLGSRYNYAKSIEFNTTNYEYHYDYHNKYEVEEISEEEFKSTKAVQDAKEEQERLQKEAEETKKKIIAEKLNYLIFCIHHEMTLITEDTNLSELESNNVCFEFSSYKIILAKNKIFVVELEANINLLESSHVYGNRSYRYRGYETDYQSKFLENLKEFFELTENSIAMSVIDTAITNKERVEYMQIEEKSVKSTEQIVVKKSLEEATEIIKSTINDIKNSYLQLGSILSQVQNEKIYRQKYKTFAEYCAIELDMKKSQAYAYINVFKAYGNDERLSKYSFTQLQLLADNKKSVDEILIEYPCELTTRELKKRLKENVQSTGQKSKIKKDRNISITDDETQTIIKALELLKSKDTNIDINSLIKKLGG